jgi:hypothetical protein
MNVCQTMEPLTIHSVIIAVTRLFTILTYTLWVEVAIEVVLPVAKAIHCHPMTQRLELAPHLGVSFFNPLFH